MAVKTITITEDAYETLKSLKGESESFSETIKRVAGRRSLREFVGALSEETAAGLEKTIRGMRKRHLAMREKRMQRIMREMSGEHGSA